jgi:hypothetical protein
MKLYSVIEINNKNDIEKINGVLSLDDIHFIIPKKDEDISIHLDFDDIDGRLIGSRYFVRFKNIADTWTDLNLESNIKKEDITIDLLEKGYVENYIMFFTKENGEKITDITVKEIGYMDDNFDFIPFVIQQYAINEA